MDRKKYSEDWHDIIRPEILKRDQYACCICGIKHKTEVYKGTKGNYIEVDSFTKAWAQSQGKKVFKVYLTVSHSDHDKTNNDPKNLRSLCPRCHATYDAENRKLKRISIRREITRFQSEEALLQTNEAKVLIHGVMAQVKEQTSIKIKPSEAQAIISFIIKHF